MIQRRGLPPMIWWLFGLLVIAALSVSLGGHDTDSKPSTSNYDASGEAALFSLLQRAGYSVASNLESKPRLGPHDIAICLRPTLIHQDNPWPSSDPPDEEFYGNLVKFVEGGGRAVIFQYPVDFADTSKRVLQTVPAVVTSPILRKTLHVYMPASSGDATTDTMVGDHTPAWLPVWSVNGTPLVQAARIGKGELVVCDSSIPSTNRFLDKADDAAFVASVIQSVAQPGDRLVFAEASFGNVSDPGFFELLGTWALAAWRQAIVLFVVLIFTLSKRFGYPEEHRRVVQSSRDLADAFGDLLTRARRVDIALTMALARLDNRIRRRFRVPRDASIEERNRVLPENIFNAVARVEEALRGDRIRGSEALKLVQEADREIDEYTFVLTPR